MIDFRSKFELAQSYDAFLDEFASPQDRMRWDDQFARTQISDPHRETLKTFAREMNVLCLCGAWCGDCINQCPIFEHFARACPKIRLRFVDRDADSELAGELRVCGGSRVPVVVFLSEDFTECGRYGDRTLSQYRQMAGMSAPGASPAKTADEWLGEFERVQLMLRVSPRLCRLHGD